MHSPTNAPLVSLTYVSSAIELFSERDLVTLLETCRRNNAAVGVTGMLLYKDGNFMQVLEGTQEAIQPLHTKIARDPRHDGMITLLEEDILQRQFGDWSMGFQQLADASARSLPGYNEFLNTPLTSAEFSNNPSRARKLLAVFRKNI